MFMMVDYVKEMSVKKSCKYGEYGLSEHLLFLFKCVACDASGSVGAKSTCESSLLVKLVT